MQIAVCDDEQAELEAVLQLLAKYAPEIPVVSFPSAVDLLNAAENDFFPLIFLDIEMDAPDGFYAAQQLMQNDAKPLIIFVTKSPQYSIHGYDVAFNYLVKPLQEERFKHVLELALNRLIPKYFSFLSEGEFCKVPIQDILYFESKNYALIIHTANEAFSTRLSLKTLETDIHSPDFVRIHASYLINLDHLMRITKAGVHMDNGEILPISRTRKKALNDALMQFMRRII